MATSNPTSSYGGNVSSNVVEVANAPNISNQITFPDQSGALQALAQAWGTGAQAQAQATLDAAKASAQAIVDAASVNAATAEHVAYYQYKATTEAATTAAGAGQGTTSKLFIGLALAAVAAGAWFFSKHKGALA